MTFSYDYAERLFLKTNFWVSSDNAIWRHSSLTLVSYRHPTTLKKFVLEDNLGMFSPPCFSWPRLERFFFVTQGCLPTRHRRQS